jgi:hypothetical protein
MDEKYFNKYAQNVIHFSVNVKIDENKLLCGAGAVRDSHKAS